MEQLLKTWETRMLDYRKEADESKRSLERIKAINKFFAYRDCIKELKEQLFISAVSNSAFYELAKEFRNWNRGWELFDRQEISKKPQSLDEFIIEMEKKYVVGFKHCY